MKLRRKREWSLLLGGVLLFLGAGFGVATASNMGFKINKPFTSGFTIPGPRGDNWIALPYSNPYPTRTALCAALGGGANMTLTTINPVTGTATNTSCLVGSPAAIDPTVGIRVRITGASPPGRILVGTHAAGVPLPGLVGGFLAPGPRGDNWVSLPYHCTWRRPSDLCAAYGFGLAAGVTVSRVDAATGLVTNFICGQAPGGANNFVFVPGQAIRIRKVAAGGVAPVVPPVL
jgi:hypothetical protein